MRRSLSPVSGLLMLVTLGGSGALAAPLSADMIVSVPDQVLALVDRGKLFVSAKIGDRLPRGAVIKNRIPTGEIVGADAPGHDPIVSRVIWLRGMETQNQKARDRCIYIHGTPEERQIGKPASFGCIRMRSHDIIDL